MSIDAHLHVWPSPDGHDWLTAELAPICRGFTAAEAREASRSAGFDSAVLVQAADTDADTDYLLALAEAEDWVRGVVGWVPLTDARAAAGRLDAIGGRPLVGVRTLIHEQPDDALLDRAAVRETLARLAARGLPLDVPDAWPAHLGAATRAAREVDELTVVLDHLGKPPRGRDGFAAWRSAVADFAAAPGTVAKLSGLHHGGRALEGDAFRRVWDTALECFGTGRLMLGSDWPMPLLGDGLDPLATQLRDAVANLSNAERADLLTLTAVSTYR